MKGLSFAKGQIVEGEVVEEISANELIVNIRGKLLRVSNKSTFGLQPGQKIKLIVNSISPLSFQVQRSGSGHLRVTV